MKHQFSAVLLIVAFTSCVQDTANSEAANPSGTAAKSEAAKSEAAKSEAAKGGATTSRPSEKKIAGSRLDEKIYDHFGDGVAAEGETITLATLAEKSKDLTGKKIRLTGDIKTVCKKKGCWMVLSDDKQEVRIQFRDYGFFMPLDSEGRTAVLEGTFDVSETSVADLKHLLEDEGKPEEAAKVTEPKVEMKVMADGVALKKK